MTNSDIIAIIAIVVSGIISVGTLIAGYLTNKSNHRAELNKIAYEKQIEALRELYEHVADYSMASSTFIEITNESRDTNDIAPIYSKWTRAYDAMDSVYRKNAVYIPKHIDDLYHNRSKATVMRATSMPDGDILKNIEHYSDALLNEIKHYINTA